ncbi:MAG: hypothetical protein ACYC1Z_00845 [Georgenia sp.]
MIHEDAATDLARADGGPMPAAAFIDAGVHEAHANIRGLVGDGHQILSF